MARRLAPLLLLALLAACGGSPGTPSTPAATGPSGALGTVTRQDAATAIVGLCRMGGYATIDLDRANGVYYGNVHDELAVIGAAADRVDRVASARLLQARVKVEDDLRSADVLHDSFATDIGALTAATRSALSAVGVPTAACQTGGSQ